MLVVEDEPFLRLVTADALQDAGFQILEAGNADEALAVLETKPQIDILLTDIDMPGSMDGVRLAHAVRDRWPPVRLVVVSGHRRPPEAELPRGSVFFTKPYEIEAVAETLKRML
ncbi:response regulator [Kaistia dalseonensis]|uniref:CheY-like chemotaxis protein n=1 Tax=Kaistia dalseonensis TaxID=410840 RepID=A0ABU0H5F0_9HYPH|nr:response regulator [Kaistia dalseonensis]MCX5494958.1 response regulator [Kaistia dalseonensis]MDQ0437539.1 CheY-like chemotaxis protein [Kaistia dalseonensis]